MDAFSSDSYPNINEISTPFYCFDTDIFTERVMMLRQILGGCAKICFSLKANPWLVNVASEYCDYIEVCSHGELQICMESGVSLDQISVGGVSKTESECEELTMHPPYRISVESIQQFRLLGKYATQNNSKLNVLLRLTGGNQFGMPIETAVEIIRIRDEFPNINITGIHFYPGTQNKGTANAERYINFLQKSADTLDIKEIQFGPGFGVALFADQNSYDYDLYLEHISNSIVKLASNHDITIECGRYLTYQTGTYTTKIIDIKEQNGRCYLIVDGGIHQISYYGQINGKPLPIICKENNFHKGDIKCCTICGSLCTVSDILAKDINIYDPIIGDRLVFANVGAYSVTEARTLFLSRDLPSVLLKNKNQVVLVRKASELFEFNQMKGNYNGTNSF